MNYRTACEGLAKSHAPLASFPSLESQLRHGYFPSTNEVNDARNASLRASEELERYDEEIGCLKSTLETLQSQRDRLEQRNREYISYAAPIRRLPPEILQEVFLYEYHAQSLPDREHRRPGMFVLAIASVCKRWRDVATHTPALHDRILLRRNYPLVKWRLEHSGTLPLNIYIDDELASEDALEAMRLLDTQAARWSSFTIAHVGKLLPSIRQLSGKATNIVRLALYDYHPDFEFAEWCNRTFEGVKTLTSLCIQHLSAEYRIPYLNLGHLKIGVCSLSNILLALRSTAVLWELSINEITENEDGTDTSLWQPLVMTKLRSLQLYGGVHAQFLQHLTLPVLRTLTLRDWRPHPSVLTQLIERSRSRLRNLTLEGRSIHEADLLGALRLTPTVQTLHVTVHRLPTDHLVQVLRFRPCACDVERPHTPLLPKLLDLQMRVMVPFEGPVEGALLADMIESRFRMKTPGEGPRPGDVANFTRVELHDVVSSMDAATRTRLRLVRERGLNIQCTSHAADMIASEGTDTPNTPVS
ncbi:hypothetical protein BD626DRAFT_85597 [Schizophyllum amplum]|uniref:F-box domain-containing protein n=1 Tax=Schizophyllum amplum TaxID=97359 RepID=A0A550C994_9AGAR|nr:hypothetical protein BD626DRAFT_85597 [Auriculariopsis ampla]